MAGLCFIYTKNSLPNLFSSALHLRLFLRGIKHTMGLSSHQHLPVTMSLLRQIKEEVSHTPDFLPSDKLMLWLLFTLAFYNFQRSSEFTSPSASQFNPLEHLCATDVSFTSNGCLALHLKSSTTDPYHPGCSLLTAPWQRSVCAVRALRKYLALHPTGSASPLYIWQPPYQNQSYLSIPCTLLQHLGFPTELYVSHSFRIKTATSGAEAGLPPWLIQTLQRWSSNCFTIYIRTLPSVLQKVPSPSAATNTSGQGAWTPLQGHCTPSFP